MPKALFLLHSDYVQASTDLLALWNAADPIPGEVIASQEAAVALVPAFQGYPSVVYEDSAGRRHVLFNPADLAAVAAWKDGIDNQPRPTIITQFAFSKRMTPGERIAIRTAAKTDQEVEDVAELMAMAQDIDLAGPDMRDGMGLLVYKGLLTAVRAAEILAP